MILIFKFFPKKLKIKYCIKKWVLLFLLECFTALRFAAYPMNNASMFINMRRKGDIYSIPVIAFGIHFLGYILTIS